ncbi:hypothetical protein KZX45_07520 [Georgenia sp. EYE_87]|uniref:hypothetical protein n=1 Tax=Georgenia sp. EYE_87 TaxID=2853448 RepID=UPI002004C8B0|nr:hypothetical protein [Georgenia sp. EYE_87]MCK6210387.1 hypothetical protein [Georgenia sp. EYE_87]
MQPVPPELARLADRQYGVVARTQVMRLCGDPAFLRSQLRAGRWVRRVPGVYLTFTGTPSWNSRAMEALLYAGPGAALSHRSAAYRHEMISRPPSLIEVSVPHTRRRARQQGIEVLRRRHMPISQGRLRTVVAPATFVDLASGTNDIDTIVGLASAALRRTHLSHLRDEIDRRSRIPNRALLLEILGEVEDGVESPLEYRYHRDVERRHGLPRSQLQARQVLDGLWVRADCLYLSLGVRVELDGQLAHPNGRTDSDVWRDNAALVIAKDLTLRYRWVHVAVTPCATARQVAHALRSRGWRGRAVPCGPGCAVAR